MDSRRNIDVFDLSPEQSALLQDLLRDEGLELTQETGRIPRRARASAPLSYAQQRIWFLDQLQPGSPLYNLPLALDLRGPLDHAALQKTLDVLVRRHEALRTVFRHENGKPVQVILRPERVPLPVVRFSNGNGATPESCQTLLIAAARRPFDLEREPLFRAELLRVSEHEHRLLLAMHHIVSDAWSLNLLWRELVELYAAFARGRELSLPEPPIQYADFAAWQQEACSGAALETQLAFWKEQLTPPPPPLNLPMDRAPSADLSVEGAIETRLLPAVLSERVRALSEAEQTTVFMTLLAAFAALLHRYTGQDDILIGSPFSSRTRTETEGVVGFFVNTLALRTKLSGRPTFRELLGRIRDTVLAASAHPDAPFERLTGNAVSGGDARRHSLFQVLFSLEREETATRQAGDLMLTRLDLHTQVAKFDLTLNVVDRKPGLKATIEYNVELFQARTIRRMLAHFETLLRSAVENPQARVTELALLTEPEQRHLIRELNETRARFPDGRRVHELFEDQVKKTPEAIAVVCAGRPWTYRELNERADRLADALRHLGVGPEVLVGIFLERSLELPASLLAVLKAGGAYLPLDLRYPQERLALMLADAKPAVVVTRQDWREALPKHTAQLLCLEPESPNLLNGSKELPSARSCSRALPHPDSLAYVIYTSGSTGRPKGVEVTHRGVVNFLAAMSRQPGLDSSDALLAVTPLSFDIAALELFLPLTVGARVVLASEEDAADGARLAKLIEQAGITAMQATPATWRLLLQAGWTGNGRLKILCGGEALPRELADNLRNRTRTLWNLYGPTETTIWSSAGPIEPGSGAPPIGQPIANTQFYLLDRAGQPTPIGVPGELHIGGVGLARGYRGRPELTAEKFVPDPFAAAPGARLYRAGDLVRHRADGSLEFLGRLDHQVKIRGFRIELGEIESALDRHPSVSESVVVARAGAADQSHLVAYVVLGPDRTTTGKTLHEWLKKQLPPYMLPAAFVFLERMPRTPNGKVDRAALPSAAGAPSVRADRFVPPRTDAELAVAAIFAEVLGVSPVGVHDHFFDLGGHSLLATQVIAGLRNSQGVELPVRAIFEMPTPGELAAEVERRRKDREPPSGEIPKRRRSRWEAMALLDRIDQMSDDEVNTLLSSELAGSGASHHFPPRGGEGQPPLARKQRVAPTTRGSAEAALLISEPARPPDGAGPRKDLD